MPVWPIIVFWLCAAAFSGLIGAVVCGALAPLRGRRIWAWALIGFLAGISFGPIGIIFAVIVLLAGPDRRPAAWCPRCGWLLSAPVSACPRCALPFIRPPTPRP